MPEPTPVKTEAQIRGELIAPPTRRHSWINIVGPLCAIFLGVAGAAIYLKPIGTLRWIQQTRLAWSGVQQNEIALDDGLMTYYITGGYWDQDPVVMVHGLGPNAALVWRGVMEPIAEAHYKVVAPNLFGFAGSEHKQVDYTIAYQAGALAQLIDKLKLDHINLVGSDLGADVALYYAVDHPEKVERLILVSGGMFGAAGAERLRKGMLPTTPEALSAYIAQSFFDLPPMPDFMNQRMLAALANDAPAQVDMLNSVPKDEGHIRSKIGQIFNILTVTLYGAKNPYYTPSQAEALHTALPGSGKVVFKTSGPFPQLEHPDDFAESIIFIVKQSEGGN
ncbi:MAG: alpha/beta fold hydrolase [Candidatus Binataceae bacterium]